MRTFLAIAALLSPILASGEVVNLGNGLGDVTTEGDRYTITGSFSVTGNPFLVEASVISPNRTLNQNGSSIGINVPGENGDPVSDTIQQGESLSFQVSVGQLVGFELEFFGVTETVAEQFRVFVDGTEYTVGEVGEADFFVRTSQIFDGNNVLQFYWLSSRAGRNFQFYGADPIGMQSPSFRVSALRVLPLPAGVWLLLSGLCVLGVIARRRQAQPFNR